MVTTITTPNLEALCAAAKATTATVHALRAAYNVANQIDGDAMLAILLYDQIDAAQQVEWKLNQIMVAKGLR
jgi:hypothetical protein